MGVLKKLGILIVGCVIAVSALFWYGQIEPYSTEAVVGSLIDEYNVQSIQIGDTDPVISVDVYDEDDIEEVESYLKSNLSKKDLKYYELNVFLHVPLEERRYRNKKSHIPTEAHFEQPKYSEDVSKKSVSRYHNN